MFYKNYSVIRYMNIFLIHFFFVLNEYHEKIYLPTNYSKKEDTQVLFFFKGGGWEEEEE